MRRYIFGERSGIYIIDLEKTLDALSQAYEFLLDVGRRGGSVLFVGTKKQAQETVQEQASRVGMPFVNTRWLGGMLTNFQTIHGRLKRLKELREMERSGAFEFLPKKEVLRLRHEKEKLERNLSGIQDMERLPEAVYVIDTKREHIAVKEARKLGIPVVAIVDTNCDPDEVDYIIPGNDDAIRSCALVTKVIADAVQEGQYLAYKGVAAQTFEPEFEPEPAVAAEEPGEVDARRPIQLSEEEKAFFGASLEEGAAAAAETGTEAAETAMEAEEVTAAAEGSDTLATRAAPQKPAEPESATHPSVAGTTDSEPIEAEMDLIIEPEPERQPKGQEGEVPAETDEANETEGAGA